MRHHRRHFTRWSFNITTRRMRISGSAREKEKKNARKAFNLDDNDADVRASNSWCNSYSEKKKTMRKDPSYSPQPKEQKCVFKKRVIYMTLRDEDDILTPHVECKRWIPPALVQHFHEFLWDPRCLGCHCWRSSMPQVRYNDMNPQPLAVTKLLPSKPFLKHVFIHPERRRMHFKGCSIIK